MAGSFPSTQTRLTRLLVAFAVLLPLGWCFGQVLFTPRSFVFRDAAHYYFPLFQWTNREWAAGRIPLWNPQENCGVPVLADTTSSVFYPGQLVFSLPCAYGTAYNIYVVGHVLLAAFAAFGLARCWRASLPAAGLCAVSYAFGGNVLFQYCNVIFLVGAAWLPWALLAADRMLVRRSWGWALGLGAVLALMVLGGDPHTAYHAGLLAAVYAWIRWRAVRQTRRKTLPAGVDSAAFPKVSVRRLGGWGRRVLSSRFGLLALAASSAWLLAAVQMLPATQWLSGSERAAFYAPRSLYEIPEFQRRTQADAEGHSVLGGLFGRPVAGTHHEHIYNFSVGPWRLVELVWPNFSGRLFPIYRRWTTAIPAEGQIWTPSLYQGLLPLLLAMVSWRLRRGTPRVRWLTWAAMLATLGSFGWYGLGWLARELGCSLGGANPDRFFMGAPVGGLYWLLVVVLPGYAYFRYPAKLLVVTALVVSLLAARGLDRLRVVLRGATQERRRGRGDGWCTRILRRWQRALLGLAWLSLGCWVATFLFASHWSRWLDTAPGDALLGPLDVAGALGDLRGALLQTALLSSGFWWFCSRRSALVPRFVPMAGLLITAVEMCIAHGWLVATAPLAEWQRMSYGAVRIAAHSQTPGGPQPFRVFRGSRQEWSPDAWGEKGDVWRQCEGLRWDRDTLFPKYHLDTGLALLEADDTLAALDYRLCLRVARQFGPRRPDQVREPHVAVLNALAVRYVLEPEGFGYRANERIDSSIEAPDGAARRPPGVAVWYNPAKPPRAWIVHRVECLPPLPNRDPVAMEARTRRILFPNGRPRDLRRTAVVEMADQVEGLEVAPVNLAGEICRFVSDSPQRVELAVELAEPGLVVLSDLYYPGWQAWLETDGRAPREVPVLRTNRIMRGVQLPAGRHRIVYTYRPAVFAWGAMLSGSAWLGVIGLVVVRRRNANRERFRGAPRSPVRP